MSTEHDPEFHALVFEMCGENRDAAVWLLQACDLAEHIDHVSDGDPLDKEAFRRRMQTLLVEWPLNSFYRQNQAVLAVVMNNCWYAWASSDTLPECRIKAFDVASELFTTVAFLIGGRRLCDKYDFRSRQFCVKQMKANDRK